MSKNIFFNLIKNAILSIMLFASGINILRAATEEKGDRFSTVYRRAAEYYLPSLAKEAILEKEQAEALKKRNAERIEKKKLHEIELPTLSNVEKMSLAYTILDKGKAHENDNEFKLNNTVIHDLEMFCGQKDSPKEHLFKALDMTETTFGKIELQKMLLSPLTNCTELEKRQQFIKKLIEDEKFFNTIQALLQKMKILEDDVIWFWKLIEEGTEQFFNQVYFDKFLYFFDLKSFNKDSNKLQALQSWQTVGNPTFTAIYPILMIFLSVFMFDYFSWPDIVHSLNDLGLNTRDEFLNLGLMARRLPVIGEFAEFLNERDNRESLNQDLSLNVAFITKVLTKKSVRKIYFMAKDAMLQGSDPGREVGFYVTALFTLFYLLPLYNSINHSLSMNKISSDIQTKMINVAGFMNIIEGLGKFMETKAELANLYPKIKAMTNMGSVESIEAQELASLFKKATFKGDASFFSLQGRALAAYKMMQSSKDNFVDAFQAMGTIDAYFSVAKLFKKSVGNGNASWCFVEYKSGVLNPQITLKNYWHPILDPSRVVTNDMNLGLDQGSGNMIITGPNAGGKSTAIKSIVLSVLLAQTFGVAPAESMTLTPFSHIDTYMNIVDTEGKESLFQAEMRRAQGLINKLRGLRPNEFSFVVLDEIFTGTNPEEGQAAAYGVAKMMSQCSKSVSLIATHFKKLTELSESTNGRFKNCKVSVVIQDNGAIIPTYKLVDGISDQKIALQLLHNAGFGSDILDAAHAAMVR